MLAVIGLGGAGGNIADEASKIGFPVGAINFSQRDLDSLENVKHKFRIAGSEGVGHNREEAISLLSDKYNVVVDFIKEHFSHPSIEIIAFTFSTGGGSGSGISPILLQIMIDAMPEKTFIAIPILPDESEATVSQVNTLRTMEHLSELDVATFPVDNQKIKSNNPNIGKAKMFQSVNESVIRLFSNLIDYTNKFSKNGNFDKRDLLTVLGTRGISIIAEANLATLNREDGIELSIDGFSKTIQSSWDDSIFSTIDYNKVLRAGVIFDAQESFMTFLKHESIFSKFESGMPFDIFEGNYHENLGRVITILSGLTWCNTRLKRIEQIIESSTKRVENALSSQNVFESKVASNFMDIMNKPSSNKNPKSATELFSKYKK